MRFTQSTKFRLVNLPIVIPLLWITAVCLCQAQEGDNQAPSMGELKLEGKYIERLVLKQMNGPIKNIDHPEETTKLPTGKYLLQEVRLIDGYSCRKNQWVIIANDKPVVLKYGAPLKQTVKIKRQGSVLILNYELLGGGGEKYTGSNRSKPPTFTIYKGDKEIASDKFQFG
jgi:hypothetical protein